MSSRFTTAAPLFKEWAEALIQSAEPLRHVAIDEIMFLEDGETETKSDNKKYMELKKIPEFVEDFLGQHFGVTRKAYAVIVYRLNCGALDNEAMIAHLAEQLLKIPDEGRGLQQPDIKTFGVLAKALGYDWKNRVQEHLPNLIADRPKGWPARQVQLTVEQALQAKRDQVAEAMATIDNLVPDEPPATPPPDDWQPEQPYVEKAKVLQFPDKQQAHAPTGTDPTA